MPPECSELVIRLKNAALINLASVTGEKGGKVNLSNELPIQSFLPCREHHRHSLSLKDQLVVKSGPVRFQFQICLVASLTIRHIRCKSLICNNKVEHQREWNRQRQGQSASPVSSCFVGRNRQQAGQSAPPDQTSWFVAPPTGFWSLVDPAPPLLWHSVAAEADGGRSQRKQPHLERYTIHRWRRSGGFYEIEN